MSGLKKMIEALRGSVKFSSKMKTFIPTPEKHRTYSSLPNASALTAHINSPTFDIPKEAELGEDQELVLLDDIEKECLLTMMEYYQYLITFTSEFIGNDQFIRKTQDLYQNLLEDRPVKRELLYELAPELYTYTLLNKESPVPLDQLYKNLGLKSEEKAKILLQEKLAESSPTTMFQSQGSSYKLTPPKIPSQDDHKYRIGSFSIWDPEDTKLAEVLNHPHYSPYEVYRRVTYIWDQIQKTYLKSAELIEKLEEKLGSVNAVFSYLKVKGEECTEEEKQVMEGIDYINRLIQEQAEFMQSLYEYHMSNVVLLFPMPQWLQDQFMDSMKEMLEKKTFTDLAVTIGIPDNSAKMIQEMRIREQKARDAMILDGRDRSAAQNLLTERGEELLVRRELSAKDELLIKKVNLLSDSMKIEKPPEFYPDFTQTFNPDTLRLKEAEKRMNMLDIEELYIENLQKVFFLNNSNPKEFNLEFWAQNLNVSQKRLKNIFYNISGLAFEKGELAGKLSFVEVENKKELYDEFQETLKRDLKKGSL